ncbi:MAG: hypothetical protein AAF639_00115, partial [Chloroflexota bacterium]
MRRAVIIVNIITLVFAGLGIMSLIAVSSLNGSDINDDQVNEYFSDYDSAYLGVAIALTVVRALASGLGIYGALVFNVWMVGICAAVFVLEAILAVISLSLVSVIVSCFFAYPHFFF